METIQLQARATGLGETWHRVDDTGGVPEIILGRVARLAGVVRTPEGAPAAEATVVLGGSGVWPARRVLTDTEGGYAFDGLPTGVYELRAHRESDLSPPVEGLWLRPGAGLDVDLRLEVGATLRGQVLAADSEDPIADAEVLVLEEALLIEPRTTRTNGDGGFSVGRLRPVPHVVRVRAPGFVPVDRTLPPEGTVTLALRRAARVTGVVVDADRRPVVGAELAWVGEQDQNRSDVFTGEQRAFQSALFEAQQSGPARATGELGVTMGAVPPVPLASAPAAVEGATLGVYTGTGGARSDDGGHFDLRGVPPGTLQLLARHPAHPVGWSAPFVAVGGEETEVRVVMPHGARVTGRVVDGAGFPLPHTRVEMHVEQETRPEVALTDEQGHFEFHSAVGVTTFTAFPLGRPAVRQTLEVASTAAFGVELIAEDGAHVAAVRVVDPGGFGLADAHVELRSLRSDVVIRRSVRTDEDGTARLENLPAPPWLVEVDHGRFAPLQTEVRAAPDEIRLALNPASALSGEVQDAWSGEPVAGASIRLEGDGAPRITTTDVDGRFAFRRVGAGTHEVIVDAEGMVPERRRVVHERSNEDTNLDVIALTLGGELGGQVVDAEGHPVADATVAVGDRSVRTDDRGRFHVGGLREGPAVVAAFHPAAGRAEAAPRIYPGERVDAGTVRLPRQFDAATAALGPGRGSGLRVALVDDPRGVAVGSVAEGSSAAASLREGDVFVSIDDLAVESVDHLRDLLRGPIGAEVVAEVLREGTIHRLLIPRETTHPPGD